MTSLSKMPSPSVIVRRANRRVRAVKRYTMSHEDECVTVVNFNEFQVTGHSRWQVCGLLWRWEIGRIHVCYVLFELSSFYVFPAFVGSMCRFWIFNCVDSVGSFPVVYLRVRLTHPPPPHPNNDSSLNKLQFLCAAFGLCCHPITWPVCPCSHCTWVVEMEGFDRSLGRKEARERCLQEHILILNSSVAPRMSALEVNRLQKWWRGADWQYEPHWLFALTSLN